MRPVTDKQKRVFDFIGKFISDNGYAPSYTEIAANFRVNVRAVQKAVDALVRKGYIEKLKGIARGIRISERDPEASRARENVTVFPLYGRVAAGEPLFADNNIEGYAAFDLSRKKNTKDYFCLTVRGDSMTGRHILEGDVVLVRKQSTADDGDVVVALIDDEATVKEFRRKGRKVYLMPANPKYRPIERPFRVLGKITGLKRNYSPSR